MKLSRTAQKPACEVVEGLALFLRMRSIYPAGHRQVRRSAQALRDALERLRSDRMAKTTVVFRSGEALVDGVSLPLEQPLVVWLGQTLRRAHLGGVEVDAAAELSEFELFANLIVDCGVRESHPLLERWPAGHTAVRPLDLRFVGGHASGNELQAQDLDTLMADGDADLIEHLRGDPGVQDQLDRLRQLFATEFGDDECIEMDLVSRVATLVTAEAGVDVARAAEMVATALAELERELSKATDNGRSVPGGGRATVDAGLARLAQRVSEQYFATPTQEPSVPVDRLPCGRPEDAKIDDGLDDLLEDIRELPENDDRRLTTDDREEAGHLLRLLLQVCSAPEQPEARRRAATRLQQIVGRYPDLDLSVVREFTASQDPAVREATRGMLEELVQAGLGSRLAADGVLDVAKVVESFPASLGSWLPLLDDAPRSVVDLVADAVGRMPRECFRPTLERLIQEGILDAATFRALIQSNRPEFLTLLQDAVLAGGWKAIHALAEAVRDMPHALHTGAAARLLPADWLSEHHLLELCRLAQGGRNPIECQVQAARQLMCFVTGTARSSRHEPTRLEAVRSLGLFPGPEVRKFLRRLARPRWLGGAEPSPIRQAARQTLRTPG